MKKTILALMVLASVSLATETPDSIVTPDAVWTLNDISLSGHATYTTDDNGVTLTSLNLTGATGSGYTAMITMNWTKVNNAPAFWFATTDGTSYANSTATFGYRGDQFHACLFSTGGSNSGSANQYTGQTSTLPDYVTDSDGVGVVVGEGSNNTSLAEKTLTYFITSEGGTTMLYELLDDGSVAAIAKQTGMKTGTLETLVIGHWNGANSKQDGTMDIQLYSGVLTAPQMKSLTIPEPTTATLSLLALAGLCARRRRK